MKSFLDPGRDSQNNAILGDMEKMLDFFFCIAFEGMSMGLPMESTAPHGANPSKSTQVDALGELVEVSRRNGDEK